jgi:hypothetical protein
MSTYPFLSDEWIEAAHQIRAEAEASGSAPAVPSALRMNLVITQVPFGDGSLDAHLDTSSGLADLDAGHIDPADLKVTVDYVTARSILVEGNFQAAMQAFMAGKVRVDGDMTKLFELQGASPGPGAAAMAERLKGITE